MKVFRSIQEWHHYRSNLCHHSIGFVPTMGALHAGHLSLVENSRQANECTVVSIFVNPGQFDEEKDFSTYPVELEEDLAMLEQAGTDIVLLPDNARIYADGYRFRVTETEFSRRLCGVHRPGHFDGVLTVVMRLLNIVKPHNAYFGEKDYQQLQLVRDMVAAFFMPVNIVACPTRREPDGLAMSSRNQRLEPQERKKAALLFDALTRCSTAEEAVEVLKVQGFDVEYVEDIDDRRLAAVRLGDTRLIDNVAI